MSIHQRFEGSWSAHDAVRHFMYESLSDALVSLPWEDRPYRLIEIGSRDPTSPPIRMTTAILGDRCRAEVGNWPEVNIEGMPYSSESVDIFVADQVLEHVQKPWLAAEEVWRVTKTGGLAIINTPFLHPIHLCPLDCWRIGFDGYKVLFPENRWEVIVHSSWGNRSIIREIYDSELSKGMTDQWIPISRAKEVLPSFETPPDGLHPIVMWWLGRKK